MLALDIRDAAGRPEGLLDHRVGSEATVSSQHPAETCRRLVEPLGHRQRPVLEDRQPQQLADRGLPFLPVLVVRGQPDRLRELVAERQRVGWGRQRRRLEDHALIGASLTEIVPLASSEPVSVESFTALHSFAS